MNGIVFNIFLIVPKMKYKPSEILKIIGLYPLIWLFTFFVYVEQKRQNYLLWHYKFFKINYFVITDKFGFEVRRVK